MNTFKLQCTTYKHKEARVAFVSMLMKKPLLAFKVITDYYAEPNSLLQYRSDISYAQIILGANIKIHISLRQ